MTLSLNLKVRVNMENKTMPDSADFDQLMTEVESQGAMLAELAKTVALIHDHMIASSDGTILAPVTQTKIDNAMTAIIANRAVLMMALEKVHQAAQLLITPPTPPANLG